MTALAANPGALAEADDSILIDMARDRDAGAIRVLVQRNNLRLYRIARAVVRDDAEAEDVVQEALLRGFTRLDTFRGDADFTTWLTRIALNEAYAQLRRHKAAREADEAPVCPAAGTGSVIMFPRSPSPGPEADVARRQLGALIESAIDELPEPFRIVFVLREIEELSIDETARQLDLKPATVKTRLHRAKRLLRTSLAGDVSAALKGTFPFGGKRCARMADKVARMLCAPARTAD